MYKYRDILTWPDPKAVSILPTLTFVRITELLKGKHVSIVKVDDEVFLEMEGEEVLFNEVTSEANSFETWAHFHLNKDNLYENVIYHGTWLEPMSGIDYTEDSYFKFYLEDLEHNIETTFHSSLNEVGTEFVEKTGFAFHAPLLYIGNNPDSFVTYIMSSKLGTEKPYGLIIRDVISNSVIKILNSDIVWGKHH